MLAGDSGHQSPPSASGRVAPRRPAPSSTMASGPLPAQTTTVAGDIPPLTTPWHGPESCTWTYDPTQAGAIAWLDLKPRPGETTLSCYPDGMFDGNVWGVFSPASCPDGWTTVHVHADTDKPSNQATTTATCCSSNYEYENGHCGRSIPYVVAVPITYITANSTTTYSIQTETTTTLHSATVAVHAILAEWEEADDAAVGFTDGNAVADKVDGAGPGLSVEARVGLGVGLGVGLLIVSALMFLLIRRRLNGGGSGDKASLEHEMYMNAVTPTVVYGRARQQHHHHDWQQHHDRRHHQPHGRRVREVGADPAPSCNSRADEGGSIENGAECREVDDRGGGGRGQRRVSTPMMGSDTEIHILREQKETIQRRIDELEGRHR